MSQLSDRSLQRAIGQIGQQENPKGSNWGHPVQDYLAAPGVYFPASWCMAFLYWCFKDAAGQLGISNPLYKTAGCLAQWNNSKSHQILTNPEPGDIFIMDHGHGLGHCGIVENTDADGNLHTVEGNTNDTGSREGFQVIRKIRARARPIIGYLRF